MDRDRDAEVHEGDQIVESVDYEVMPVQKARTLSKRSEFLSSALVVWFVEELHCLSEVLTRTISSLDAVFYGGFCFLPLMWGMNVWLFWPDFKAPRGDPIIRKCECCCNRSSQLHGTCACASAAMRPSV